MAQPCTCTLEPCNWCFKQLIQSGIREIYFEEYYDSRNKEFDLYWRKIMESNENMKVFQQVKISPEASEMVLHVLTGNSSRQLPATSPDEETELDTLALLSLLSSEAEAAE